MTQKEKLYEQLLIASNEYKQLSGRSEMIVDIDAIKRDRSFYAYAKMSSLSVLKEDLSEMQAKIRDFKATKATEEYFATLEGAKIKDELEAQLAAEKDTLLFNRERYSFIVKNIIATCLEDDWKISGRDASNIHIYQIDPTDGRELFGHEFNLSLGYDVDREDQIIYHIDTNIPSGSFNATHNKNRVSLYKIFAEIISNKQLMDEILFTMVKAKETEEMIKESISEINMRLDNPLTYYGK